VSGDLVERVVGAVADGRAPDDLTAEQAVERIRALREFVDSVSAVAEAHVMAACWSIRREIPEREAFETFAAGRLGDVLGADRAWALAQAWDAARHGRSVRELARKRPHEAVALVRDYAEAVPGGDFDDLDREAAAIVSLPGKQRRERLRELAASASAARAGRHPDDVERIRVLEAERDEAEAADAARAVDPASTLAEDERRLAARADEFDALRGRLSAAAVDRLLRVADMAMGSLERIMAALQEGGEP